MKLFHCNLCFQKEMGDYYDDDLSWLFESEVDVDCGEEVMDEDEDILTKCLDKGIVNL